MIRMMQIPVMQFDGDSTAPRECVPIPVILDDRSLVIVPIPRMSETSFDFLMARIREYESAIVIRTPLDDDGESDVLAAATGGGA